MTDPAAALVWTATGPIATRTPGGVRWQPLETFLARSAGAPLRLAYFEPEGAREFPPGTADEAVERALPEDWLLHVERHPQAVQVLGVPEPVVERLGDFVDERRGLTSYVAVIRALASPLRAGDSAPPGRVVVVHAGPQEPWLFAFHGPVVMKVRPLRAETLAADVRQTLSAIEFDPATDRLLATPEEQAALGPALESEPFDLGAALDWLATAEDPGLPVFLSTAARERQRAAVHAGRRRLVLRLGLGAVGLGATMIGVRLWQRSATELVQRLAGQERAELVARVRARRRQVLPALLRARQPAWAPLLADLARQFPDDLLMTRLKVERQAPGLWALRATARAASNETAATVRLGRQLGARLDRSPIWRGARLDTAIVRAQLAAVLTARLGAERA